jgi:hypothetical protein
MAAQLTLMKGCRAVHLDEGLFRPAGAAVDGPGHQLLAGAALAGDEHRGVGGRRHADGLAQLPHGRSFSHHTKALAGLAAQPVHLAHHLLVLEHVAQPEQQRLGGEWLLQQVAGAVARGLHRRGHVGVAADHDDRRVHAAPPQILQHLHAVHVRHLDVQQNDVRRVGLDLLDALRPGRRLEELVALMAQHHPQAAADVGLVVDDEDAVFHLGTRAAGISRQPRRRAGSRSA